MKLFFVLLILTIAFIGAFLFFMRGYAKTPKALPNEVSPPLPKWATGAVIYEIFVRDFTPEGTLNALRLRLGSLQEQGITVVWLMPIHPIGKVKKKGPLGCPYSVNDYYDIAPELGTKEDFKAFVTEAHRLGLKVMLDWVGNHTSWDHAFIAEHPEYYVKTAKGDIALPHPDWTDVAQLNYAIPEVQDEMKRAMLYWVKEFDIDGYRCDVAEMVPMAFWKEVFTEIRTVKPDFLALAEGTIPELHVNGFHLTYAWNFYDALKKVFSGKRPATAIDDVLEKEGRVFPKGSHRMRFISNHDKQLEDGTLMEVFQHKDAVKAAAVLNFTIGGAESIRSIPMYYNGDEVLNARRLSLFEKSPIRWNTALAEEFHAHYRSLSLLRKQHPALSLGTTIKLRTSGDELIYAFERKHEADRVVVVVNTSSKPFSGFLQVDADKILVDLYITERTVPTRDGNIKLSLEPYDFRILTYR